MLIDESTRNSRSAPAEAHGSDMFRTRDSKSRVHCAVSEGLCYTKEENANLDGPYENIVLQRGQYYMLYLIQISNKFFNKFA